jgi:hypothetical protein
MLLLLAGNFPGTIQMGACQDVSDRTLCLAKDLRGFNFEAFLNVGTYKMGIHFQDIIGLCKKTKYISTTSKGF